MKNRSLHCASVRPTTQDSMKANSSMDSNAKMMKKKHKIKTVSYTHLTLPTNREV